MTIEIPEQLESALKVHANARGVSPAAYLFEVLERDFEMTPETKASEAPFKTGLGMWSKYGVSISEEEIDENRAEMFRHFGEDF